MSACIRNMSGVLKRRLQCSGSAGFGLFFVMLLIAAGLSPRSGWAQFGEIIFADDFERFSSGIASIQRFLVYRQIAESPVAIQRLKMSADGSRIIFASGNPKAIYTVKTDGTELTEVFDYADFRSGCPCITPFIDISADGSTIIWTDSTGEIFVADGTGGGRLRIATEIPRPLYSDTESPDIRLTPRITANGGQIYFVHSGSTADNAGGYVINANGTGLAKLFDYLGMAQLFNSDPELYNRNTVFYSNLDIDATGSRMVFGTRSFQAAGNIVTFAGGLTRVTEFTNESSIENTNQIMLTPDGETIVAYKPDPLSAISLDFDGGNEQVILSDVNSNGVFFSRASDDGKQILASARDADQPVTLVNTDASGRLDLVLLSTCPPDPFRRAGIGPTSSLSGDARRFAFKTEPFQAAQQIWIADINPTVIGDAPAFAGITFDPSFLVSGVFDTSTFTADTVAGSSGIDRVCGDAYENGEHRPLTLSSAGSAVSVVLFDDGTNGDLVAGDGRYTNDAVQDSSSAPLDTPLTIRFSAIAGSESEVTAVDSWRFEILSQSPDSP